MHNIIGTITLYGETLNIVEARYTEGAPAILLEDADGGPYCTFSTNLDGANLAAGEVLVKTWSENEDMRQPMLESGLFEDTGRRVPNGFIQAEVWRRVVKP
jgi:hypothetical protein